MANEISCVADVETDVLEAALRKLARESLHIRRRSSDDLTQTGLISHPRAIWFWELRGSESPTWVGTGGIGHVVALAPKRGECAWPFGASEFIWDQSPGQLAKRIGALIDRLIESAEQRIVLARPISEEEIEVQFLDGEVFSLPLDREHNWTQLCIAPDHRYLIVPRNGGALDTIPWDAIRRPDSHLDEERRTQRRLAETLRSLRKEADLSQEKAAQASGLTRQTIIRLEKAGNYPGLKTLRALARTYGLTVEGLLARLRSS